MPEEMLDIYINALFWIFNRLLVNEMVYVDLDLSRLNEHSGKGQLLAFLSCVLLSLLVATFVVC